MNPRYTLYLKTTKAPTNWGYMAFIDRMKKMYCGDAINGHIADHEKFTKFIKQNTGAKNAK